LLSVYGNKDAVDDELVEVKGISYLQFVSSVCFFSYVCFCNNSSLGITGSITIHVGIGPRLTCQRLKRLE